MDAVNVLQQVVPWLAGLPILQRVIATIIIVGLVTLLLLVIWTPPPDQAVSTILSDCHRRALFTRMHAQLSEEAVFSSIEKCRETLQVQIPEFVARIYRMRPWNFLPRLRALRG
jgi:hypothetical protein